MMIPRYCANADNPAAVPLSLRGNHLTVRAVTEFIRNGWAMAKPVWQMSTIMKLSAKNPFPRAENAAKREPMDIPFLIP